MAVERRVVEQQLRRLSNESGRIGATLRQPDITPNSPPHFPRRTRRRHRPLGDRRQELGKLIDQLMSRVAKLLRGHFCCGITHMNESFLIAVERSAPGST
jgi:hypothetical protein